MALRRAASAALQLRMRSVSAGAIMQGQWVVLQRQHPYTTRQLRPRAGRATHLRHMLVLPTPESPMSSTCSTPQGSKVLSHACPRGHSCAASECCGPGLEPRVVQDTPSQITIPPRQASMHLMPSFTSHQHPTSIPPLTLLDTGTASIQCPHHHWPHLPTLKV